MLWVPTARLAVLQAALPPDSATLHTAAPSDVNATVPVGAFPVTVAVKVTIAPTCEGLPEVASAVVVEVLPPPTLTVTERALAVALFTVTLTPLVLSVYVCPASSAASAKLPDVAGVMSSNSVSSPPQFVQG